MPIRTIRVRESRPDWLGTDLKRLVSAKNRMYRRIRHEHFGESWTRYKAFRNYVNKQIVLAKKMFYSKQMAASSTSFYRQVNALLGKAKPKSSSASPSLRLDSGDIISEPLAVASEFNNFFTTIPTPACDIPTAADCPNPASAEGSSLPSNLSISTVTDFEVSKALAKLVPHKRGGTSQIPASVYQCLAQTVVPCLTIIINTSLETGRFPEVYKHALVTPIYKRGISNSLEIIDLSLHYQFFRKSLKQF